MSTKNNEGENLSRIRDILFGEELETIDKQFADFKIASQTAFDELKKEHEDRLNILEEKLKAKSKDLDVKQKEHENVQTEIKEDLRKEIQMINLEVIKEKTRVEKTIIQNDETLKNKIEQIEADTKKILEEFEWKVNKRIDEFENKMINKELLAKVFNTFSEELKK